MDGPSVVGVKDRITLRKFYDICLSNTSVTQLRNVNINPLHADDKSIFSIFYLFYWFVLFLKSLLPKTEKILTPSIQVSPSPIPDESPANMMMSDIEKLGSKRSPLVPKPRQIIQDYSITDNVLGLGINGKVVECFDRKTNMKYAIKVSVDIFIII